MKAEQLSRQLRKESGGYLEERRIVAGLALAAAGCMGLIALYQIGIIRHLPDLPAGPFKSDEVDASAEAYSHLQMGDAFIGLGSYAATAGLAAMGGKDRPRKQPWIPLMLAGKATADAATAAKLTYDQWSKHKGFCIYCLIAAGTTFAALPIACREAAAAVRGLLRRR